MLNFSVEISKTDEVRRILGHIPGAAEKAIAKALNSAATTAKKEAIRKTKGRYAISPEVLEKSLKIVRASPGRLKATFISSSSLLALTKFNTKQGKALSIEVIRGNNKRWPYAFLAKMGSGHAGVWGREKEYTIPTKNQEIKSKRASRGVDRGPVGSIIRRQKLVEKLSISIPEAIGHHEIIDEILLLAGQKIDGELNRQIELFLRGDQA